MTVAIRFWRCAPRAAPLVLALSLGACDRGSAQRPGESVAEPAREGESPGAAPAESPWPTRATRTVASADGGFAVRFATEPDPIEPREPFVLHVELFRDAACTTPLGDGASAAITVDASMPHHGHGMNVRPTTTSLGNDRYRVHGMLFHMPGRWELFFDRTVDGITERAQVTLEIEDLPASPPARTP